MDFRLMFIWLLAFSHVWTFVDEATTDAGRGQQAQVTPPRPAAKEPVARPVTRTRRVQVGTERVQVKRCFNGRCWIEWQTRPVYRTETYTEPAEATAAAYRSQWPPVWSLNGTRNYSRGYILSHLRNHPNHRGKHWQTWDLESWTLPQLAALHDDDHTNRVPTER